MTESLLRPFGVSIAVATVLVQGGLEKPGNGPKGEIEAWGKVRQALNPQPLAVNEAMALGPIAGCHGSLRRSLQSSGELRDLSGTGF